MRPGRPPEPAHLKLMKGNPGKRRLPQEPQPKTAPTCPEPPPHLDGFASDLWWETAPELHRLGLLTVLDVPALACYCHAYGQWRMAVEALQKMQLNDPVMNAQIIRSKYGDPAVNPLLSIARKHAADLVRYAAEFGLTSAARARLGAYGYAPPSPPSKFDGLLSGGAKVVPLKPRGDESA
jgi:P27 family predicted phage terminase small subunit